MIKFLKSLFFKPKPRLYPVADPKKISYTQAKDYVVFVLLFALIAAMSCSPTASLPNGCKYKLIAPKFSK